MDSPPPHCPQFLQHESMQGKLGKGMGSSLEQLPYIPI
jgi:hypothetical protein